MRWKWLAAVIMGMLAFNAVASNGATSPYGTAGVKTRPMPVLNTVFDVSYDDQENSNSSTISSKTPGRLRAEKS